MDAQELRNLQEAYVDVYCELDEGTAEDVAARARKLARRKGQTPEIKKMYQDLAIKAGERARQNNPTQTVGSSRFDYNQRHGRPLITPQVSQSRSSRVTLGGGTYRRGSERLPKSQRKYYRQVLSGVRAASEQEKERARIGMGIKEDIYDIILSHLLDEGYAETVEAAESIMVNMSEDWRESICEANRGDEYATRDMSPEDANTWKSERRNETRGFGSDVKEKKVKDELYKEKYGKLPDPDPKHIGNGQLRRRADTKANRGKRTTLTHTTSDTLSPSGIRGTVTKPVINIGTPLGGTQNPEPKGKYLHKQQVKDAQSSDPTKRSRAPQNYVYHMN